MEFAKVYKSTTLYYGKKKFHEICISCELLMTGEGHKDWLGDADFHNRYHYTDVCVCGVCVCVWCVYVCVRVWCVCM